MTNSAFTKAVSRKRRVGKSIHFHLTKVSQRPSKLSVARVPFHSIVTLCSKSHCVLVSHTVYVHINGYMEEKSSAPAASNSIPYHFSRVEACFKGKWKMDENAKNTARKKSDTRTRVYGTCQILLHQDPPLIHLRVPISSSSQ